MKDRTPIDASIDSIHADTPSADEIKASADRVRAAIAAQRGPQAVVSNNGEVVESWNSIDDYVAAIPAYLAKQLSESQTVLFEEEARSSIPLRRALNEARQQTTGAEQAMAEGAGSKRPVFRWLAAAAAVAVIAVSLIVAVPDLPSLDQTRVAQVEEIDGQLYQIVDGSLERLTIGTWIDGQQRLRSASGSSAIITLDDGSQIEVDERSEISMTRRGSGNRIDVSRGRILVAASPQGSGTLDVFTNEFMVSVTGTIFEVAHGAKGSRVAVVEGEVNVLLQGNTTALTPGETMASRLDFLSLNVEDEIAWSRDASEYIGMLQEVAALQQDLEAIMESQPRYSTRLLDLAPADTAIYIAVPNAPEKIAEVYDVVRMRAQNSEYLAQVWAEFEGASEGQHLDETMSWVREIGYTLGEETVFAITMTTVDGEPLSVPVVLSEVDADAFTANFDQQLQQLRDVLAAEGNDEEIEIALISDPSEAVDGQLSIWIYEDILVATVDAATMIEMQSVVEDQESDFVDTELHSLLQSSYDMGTQILGAIHIQHLISPVDVEEEALVASGMSNAQYLIAQHQQNNGETTISADLFFSGNAQGAMALLSTPAPMGSLEFFSADSSFAAAMLLNEPASILDEFGEMELADDMEAAAEIELFTSLISVLGGEVAIGLDGPALPTPAWKVVIEAFDATLLQQGIEQSVALFNAYSLENEVGASIKVSPASVNGFSGYEINLLVDESVGIGELADTSFSYAYVDGYLIAAPNAALIDRAIGFYESGSNLPTDSEFRELLARDGYLDFSAVYFSRLGELIGDITANLPSNLTEEQQAAVSALDVEIGASMASVLALPDKMHFAYSGSSQMPLQIMSQLVTLQPLLESMAAQADVQ
ncbi:MAG: hypothetical protein DHS20C12_09500 [Pseudohongiella sp.]|nr:MAG: hypothetical protein DHS20C12_09500 [Pseudohongiella sp.]